MTDDVERVEHQDLVLMLTDIVESTRIFTALGERSAAQLWAAHDLRSRELMRRCAALEVERGDGFLLLFHSAGDAARFAAGYHALLQALSTPLSGRVGIHRGPVRIRHNVQAHVEAGARPLDLDGQAKAITARVQSLAQPGQTLATSAAVGHLKTPEGAVRSHGFWQLKGVPDPLEIFELGPDGSRFTLPPDAEKVWRVVRAGELWLPARQVPHSLPAERDRFVGRRAELNALADSWMGARLVSILGTGGTGKTRLALHYGWSRLGEHPGGVWFCDLSAATTVNGIVHAAARGLRHPLSAADSVLQLADVIASRGDCLVVLDNFEQVARHAEATLGHWLAAAPEAKFLITTRELLGMVGERALALSPLDATEAQALLRERAAHSGAPTFCRADEQALPALVRLLDGLPLAIELAASRMRVLGPAALLPRMNERFDLLIARSGRLDRQATLRATLDWSWDLLTDLERCALAQFSVFEGGFTLDAARAVIDLTGPRADTTATSRRSTLWVVDVLQALVDKSLVRRVGERRFDMLRTIQEYAGGRLLQLPAADDASDGPATRHALHYAALPAEEATADGCADLDNLVAACRHATACHRADVAVGALRNAWAALRLMGPLSAAIELALQVAAIADAGSPAPGYAWCVAGHALWLRGEQDAARIHLRTAFERSAPGSELRAAVLCTLGELESTAANTDLAERLLHEALAVACELALSELQCRALNALGALDWDRSRLDSARGYYTQALARARAAGLRRWEGALLGNLGILAWALKHFDQAESFYRQALEAVQMAGDQRYLGNTHCNLGMLLLDAGRPNEAKQHLDTALGCARSLGDLRLEATCCSNLGIWHEQQADTKTALVMHWSAVQSARGSADPRSEGIYRTHLGRLLARNGELDGARSCLTEGQVLLDTVGDEVNAAVLRCTLGAVQRRLGDERAADKLEAEALEAYRRCGLDGDSELGRALEAAGLLNQLAGPAAC